MVIGTGWCVAGIRLLVVAAAEDRIAWREVMLVRCTAVLRGSGELGCGGREVVADRCSCFVLVSFLLFMVVTASSFAMFASGSSVASFVGSGFVGVLVVVVVFGRHDEVVRRWMIGFSN